MVSLSVAYFTGQALLQEEVNVGSIVLLAIFEFVIDFLFGMIILGFLGILFAKLFFLIHDKTSKTPDGIDEKYIILHTGYKLTGREITYRAFLLYCIAISLALTTIQLASFAVPGLLPSYSIDPEGYKQQFELLYTGFVFLYTFVMAFVLPPVWYFDDLNVMVFRQEEGVPFLYPLGKSVLPALKGFGGPTIILSYLVFIFNRLGTGIPVTFMLDPILTLFVPLAFIIGFESVATVGKHHLLGWLKRTRKVKEYSRIKRELVP